jgi:hypothetical protein
MCMGEAPVHRPRWVGDAHVALPAVAEDSHCSATDDNAEMIVAVKASAAIASISEKGTVRLTNLEWAAG